MEKFINKAEMMLSVMSQVSEEWENLSDEQQDFLAEQYPLDKSFDEVVSDLKIWLSNIKEQ
ncbi:hypothetical protein [Priestia endophytica]|uniref:Uncharacterized protein n=1 Tax=Priestia endophytica TaxID=135735 RepID=A0AAX1Q7W6_9BACI|nr:hypothetical protein [Priestia endophytica]RAS76662.1 hypothetical protein A3864_12630 [Priestia endophytica]